MNNLIIRKTELNVNTFDEDILIISEELDKQEEQDNKFYSLVPKIHLSAVKNLVKVQFNNKLEDYLKTIPTFFNPLIWNKNKKDDTDEKFITKRSNRDRKSYKKTLVLHSAQLLKLIGSNRQKVATKAMVNEYVEDMENSDNYINSLRLINVKGKIIKLETNKEKQFKKLARMNKIADTMDLLAKDKDFTNSMITLTLPPSYHPNPQNNNCSYNGATPQQAQKLLMTYWKAFRAMLSNNGFIFGENLIGLMVIEVMGDSTLHLHSIFYHDKKDEVLLTECLHKVEDNYNIKQSNEKDNLGRIDKTGKRIRGFDIQYSNQKTGEETYQRGSSYLMKYLYKTHTTYDDTNPDDSVLKNQTCRWFYGIRAFNFFGFNGAISKFDFLIKNYKSYENALPDEIKNCLKTGDLYSFIKIYNNFFTNEYNKDSSKRRHIGVIFSRGLYKKSFNQEKQNKLVLELLHKLEKEIDTLQAKLKISIEKKDFLRVEQLNKVVVRKQTKIESLETTNELVQEKIDEVLSSYELVLIEKKIFSIFQSNEKSENLTSIDSIDLNDLLNSGIKQSYDNAINKQDELNFIIEFSKDFYNENGISLLTLSNLNLINQSLNKRIKNLDKSIGVQLFKAIQGGSFKQNATEEIDKRDSLIGEIHYQLWLEEHEIFN